MRSVVITAASALALALALGCKEAPKPVHRSDPSELEVEAEAAPPGQVLGAAGVELVVPPSWTVVEDPDPNFALAWGLEGKSAEIPMCTIELRRQGPGDLPAGAELSPSTSRGTLDYRRGGLKGRLRELPGPTPSASLIVQCRAPRAGRQWVDIEAMFKSMTIPAAPPELPPLVDESSPIVELCAGTPVRRTQLCARRRDGAVFCGLSSGTQLRRVDGLPAAAQLSCEHDLSCMRDDAGAVSCWRVGEAPVLVEGLGAARDLAGGCAVDERGALLCRTREVDGSLSDRYEELLPLGDAKLALTGVVAALEGSDEARGCVLREGDGSGQAQLWCWDRDEAPRRVDAPANARDLARIGERLCVLGTTPDDDGARWTCSEGEQRWELDGCERRACGCSLIGATRLSCEHEPHARIDSRVFGRISGVVAVSGACAARLDGRVICRGPAPAGAEGAQVIEAVAAGLPGVAHELELSENPM